MRAALPSRVEVLSRVRDLRAGRVSREAVAAWAFGAFNDADKSGDFDQAVREVLVALGAADLPSSDRPHLYEDEDFAAWEASLL